MAILWGRRWTREELLARVGRLEQVAGIRLIEGGDGAERGVRMLRCATGAGFDFRGFPGGLVSTCGLDHTLLGGPDDATVFNYPHRATETYGLHGRYTGLPARLADYGASWHGDDCALWAGSTPSTRSPAARRPWPPRRGSRHEINRGGTRWQATTAGTSCRRRCR